MHRAVRPLISLILSIGCAAAWAQGLAASGEGDASAWVADGKPTALAGQAVALLQGASAEGLVPDDYRAEALAAQLDRLRAGARDDAPAREFAAGIEAQLQHLLQDLHYGRIDPRELGVRFRRAPRDGFDPAPALRAAVAQGDLALAVRAAEPVVPLYGRLREALARYQAMSGDPAWTRPLPQPVNARQRPIRSLQPGDAYAGADLLAARLAALGDLPAGSAAPSPGGTRYDGMLADAVKAFQRRHGLRDDGVIGRATLAALEVPPAARARQIALTMERLRWTPLMDGPRMIVINLPEFVLRAYEVADGRIVVRERMKVIVGKALDTRTPMIEEDMRSIEFSPYWNVPASIARKELVPLLRRAPSSFDVDGFEFVDRSGHVERSLSPARLDDVLAGRARLRQRPGPRNALGDIKFVFPNDESIYLHHTPATDLFASDRRDFSHGCIRVEHPTRLAMFVLDGMADWSESRVRAAMEAGTSATLALTRPVPVLIAYGTALVEDDSLHFFDDIYGHDGRLEAALRRHSRQLASRRGGSID